MEAAMDTGRRRPAGRGSRVASVARLEATVAGLNAIVWEGDPATPRVNLHQMSGPRSCSATRPGNGGPRRGCGNGFCTPTTATPSPAGSRADIDRDAVDLALTYRAGAACGKWVWLRHLGHVARDETGAAHTLHAV